ncbi:MAG: proline racemase family protein [Pseudomonas fluorescens]|nr:proline racemase family protein [Pseudomonas fluorescens]
MKRISVIDSHTGGEPTRLVTAGFPDLGTGSMAERRKLLGEQHDQWRAACMLEPRGSDVLVGALLCTPVDPGACAGVIFFNNTGYLGMCGHGTIGLIAEHGLRVAGDNLEALTAYTFAVQQALEAQGIRGEDGGLIDHVELFADDDHADSRNFVLCPGKAYDRSPCGTGTSAKLACLAADDKLQPGQIWRQASVIGSEFEGSYELQGERIVPTIRGRAFISAEASLIIQQDDPFAWGIRP